MKEKVKEGIKKIAFGPLNPIFYAGCRLIYTIEYMAIVLWAFLRGKRKPVEEDVKLMRENVTFLYKSFERQTMAKRLYKNIQAYYPGIRVIIADDSKTPLDLQGENLTLLNLPYNSGLSYGLNRALEQVETPYVIRMDDDELLTPYTRYEDHLRFLMGHPEIDMVGILPLTAPRCRPVGQIAAFYKNMAMNRMMLPVKIPYFTVIEKEYTVLRKTPNIFLVRTEALREVGYDDNIRMLDHTEFFIRATGVITTVMHESSFVFHYHDMFDANYLKHRSDIEADYQYIENKMTNMPSRF